MKVNQELFFDCYTFYKNKNFSSRTLDILKTNLQKFYSYLQSVHQNNREIEKIDYKLIEDYKTYLSSQKNNKYSIYYHKNKFLSPKTIEMRLTAVKNFLKYVNLVYQKGLDYRLIETPRIHNQHINFLEEGEVKELLEVVNESEQTVMGRIRSELLIILGYTTGLRLSELLNLKIGEVLDGKATILGKGSKERLVFFLPKTQELLSEYLQELKKPSPQTGKVLKRKNKADRVFISHNAYNFGSQLSKESVCGLFKKYNAKLNIPGKRITCHALRHSFATRLMDKGINLREIQTMLGHSDLKTTEGYTHVRNPQLEASHKLAFDDFGKK